MRSSRDCVPFLPSLALLIVACAPPPPSPASGEGAAAREPVTTGTVGAADGVPIVYETAGDGDTAVVFVHCWACNRQFWRHQMEPVARAGYFALALDLPGHGESGAARAEWTVQGLAADVEQVLDELNLQKVVLVGHSMGGPVSLEAARRMPGRVIGIICVDTLHNAEYEWPEGAAEDLVRRMREDFRGGIEYFVPYLFKADADPEVVKWVIDQATASDAEAMIALIRDSSQLDLRALLSSTDVPIRCINAAPEGERGVVTAVETNRKYADFDAELMNGVGHYPQIERPAEFNGKLLEALGRMAPQQ